MACIMEVLGLPHPSLLRHSSQIDRYFIEYKCDKLKPSALEAYDKIGVRVNKDSVYLPRYCSIRYSMVDNSPQLLPGLSKRGGHVRGIPNSMPLLQAITQSRLRRYKRKDTRSVSNLTTTTTTTMNHISGHKMSEEEEAYMDEDNELVVNLVASCLSWLPNERIQSNKAIVHSWFNHFYHNHKTNSNNGNNGKSHTGFRSPLRVRSMEVSKFVSSKFMNELNERQLIHDYRNSRESLGKDAMMLNKPELVGPGAAGGGGGGLRNHGQQKASRLNMNTSHLFNLDVTGNNASLNDLTSVRNSFMIDAQVSPITAEEVKLAQRNSQITIVPRVPVQNQTDQSDYYSNTVSLIDSPIITSIKDLSQSLLTQPPQTATTTMSATKLNLTSSSSSSSSLSVSSAAVPATASASGRVTLVYSSSNNNNNNNNKNGNIELGNNRDGRLLAVNVITTTMTAAVPATITATNAMNAVATSNQNTTNINNACDDITISNTYNSLFKLTDNTTVGGYRRNSPSSRSSSSSSSTSSGAGSFDGINYTSVNDIKHKHQQSSSPLSFHPHHNAQGILTSLNDKNSSGNLLLKSYPTGYTKPDTIYQSKMILDRNTTTTNLNDTNGIGIVKPISGYIVNTYTTHDPNNISSISSSTNHKTKIITDTEPSSDTPTLLITTGGGQCCSASESTPHLPNLIKLNANYANSPISKIMNASNRYSYSNLHQPSMQSTLGASLSSSQVQAPFISSLRIDKPLNNSMHNIVNISKMKLSYDNQDDDQSDLSINNDGVKKRYSVPSRSRLIDIPQSEYEIPVTGNNTTTNNNNNNNRAGSVNDRYAKQDLHFIPVTSNAFSSITLTSNTFSPLSNTVTLSSSRNTTISNGPGLLHNFNTNSTLLHNSNSNNNASCKYPSALSYQRESHQNQFGGGNSSQYPQEQPRRYIATNRFSGGNSTSITPNTITNMNNNNNNNNNSNYRKLSDLTKPSMEYINAYDEGKNNDIIVYKNLVNGYPTQSVDTTITLPEIAPKPLNRTKMLLLNNNYNNNNGTASTTTTYNDNGSSSKIIYDTYNYEQSNPMKWRGNNSTNLYAPQPYSQPNMSESSSSTHRMITQRLPQHNNNNNNNNSNNGSMNCVNHTNGYVDQVQPYYAP
ncbi:unnamed protein product [Trichobilharzia regenti]|nr:unnamed protein product [Trichobilharzia regenti]